MKISWEKNLRYLIEAAFVKFGLWFFGTLNVKTGSSIASFLARVIGKRLSVSKLAYRNLSDALPELSTVKKKKIIDSMWDNLGRVIAEYPHIASRTAQEIVEEHTQIDAESIENIKAIKAKKLGCILFSAHLGNWEMGPKVFAHYGIASGIVYRPLNNPYVEKMTAKLRGNKMIGKGTSGNREIVTAILKGESIAILADQKISNGSRIKFFNKPAATTTSIAKIALRYNIDVVPARVIRVGRDFKFLIRIEKPLVVEKNSDMQTSVDNLTLKINEKLETWIREYPEQWFWVHDRWK